MCKVRVVRIIFEALQKNILFPRGHSDRKSLQLNQGENNPRKKHVYIKSCIEKFVSHLMCHTSSLAKWAKSFPLFWIHSSTFYCWGNAIKIPSWFSSQNNTVAGLAPLAPAILFPVYVLFYLKWYRFLALWQINWLRPRLSWSLCLALL